MNTAMSTKTALVVLVLSFTVAATSAQRAIGGQTMVSHVGQLVVSDVGTSGKRYSVYRYEGVLVSGDMPVAEYRRAIAATTPLVGAGERIFEVTGTNAIQAVAGYPADLEVRTCSSCEFLTGAPEPGAGRVFRFKRTDGVLSLAGAYAWGGDR